MFERTHDVLMRLRNLAAANHLRQQNDSLPVAPADLARIVTTVVERHRPLAAAKGMSIHAAVPGEPLMVNVHETLTAEAIANVLDNAIRYSSTGSVVSVALEARGDERFSLTIANPSPARPMPDEEFAGLTKIRRFRGDEGWNRRPNAPGLGLAVAREIADRSGLGLSLARTDGGGLEAVFTGGHTPTRG
jgi:two-component system sensor histidine kinase TctE